MYCPYCNNKETKVLESRLMDDAMRRRRECLGCQNRFTTYERTELKLKVVKREGRVEPFLIHKLTGSIGNALANEDHEAIEMIARRVQQKILKKKQNPVPTSSIGKFVLNELKRQDKLAYLRFASIHKQINDPRMLEKELKMIIK